MKKTLMDRCQEAADCIIDCNLDADEAAEYLYNLTLEVMGKAVDHYSMTSLALDDEGDRALFIKRLGKIVGV
jgi:hypothetical protein